jgi:hypothetical protein
MLPLPRQDLFFVHKDGTILDPTPELLQDVVVDVRRHTGAEPVVPVVHAAHEIVPTNESIGQHGPAMETTPIQDRHIVIVAHDDEIHV